MIGYKFLADASLENAFSKLGISSIFTFCQLDKLSSEEVIVHSPKSGRSSDKVISFVPVGVVCGPCSDDDAAKLTKWLEDITPISLSQDGVYAYKDKNPAALLGWMLRRLLEIAGRNAGECAAASLELAKLRLLFEQSQAAILSLEKRIGLNHASHILFQIFPEEQFVPLGLQHVELSPGISPDAIHAIDLYLKKTMGLSNSKVRVQLLGEHTNRSLQTWEIFEHNVSDGWNRFHCGLFSNPIGEPIRIVINSDSQLSRVSLRTGKPVTYSFKKALLDTAGDDRPFAIRIWSGVVGLSLPRSDSGHLPLGEAEDEFVRSARAADVLQLACPVDSANDETSVGWNELHAGLMVHPRGRTPVVARVENVRSNALIRLTARFNLAHAEASPTEFTMWAVPDSPAREAIQVEAKISRLITRVAGGTTKFKVPDNVKWVALLGEESGELSYEFDQAYSGKLDIYFATRNLDKNNHNSWAIFKDLLFETAAPIKDGE